MLARKYIWWKTPEEALVYPKRIMAQVMNMGDYDDVQALAKHFGDPVLRDVLVHCRNRSVQSPVVALLALQARSCCRGAGSVHAVTQTGVSEGFVIT
ncbi:MAG: hypothetical protein WDN06_01060 [Asticcacaulis sp.]